MTDVAPPVIHLDDLAEPRFTPEFDQVRAGMAMMAPACSLDIDALHDKASEETGLSDFGPDDYRERLELFLAGSRDYDGLDEPGKVTIHSQMLQLLKNRLAFYDLIARHPEIHDVELLPPVVIAGLPRSGTTHLHNVLAAAPTFRTLPYWEGIEPYPLPAERGIEPDPRIARANVALEVMNAGAPHLALMHEMTTEHIHEEIQLLGNDFTSLLFEALTHAPTWRDHYRNRDQTPSYEHLRLQLKALQFLRGGHRWVLKSPQHLEQLPVLNAVFPGVVVIFTHRDPLPVALSLLTIPVYTARMYCSPVPVHEMASAWAERLQNFLDGLVRDRDVIPPERSIDIHFEDFMADEIGTVERVYDLAGEPFTEQARTAITDYLTAHPRGRLGKIATSADMFGLDEQDLSARFDAYRERFFADRTTTTTQ